ncbi:histidine triad nucleotide-binding protein [Fusibacter sp. JL298sf-3]
MDCLFCKIVNGEIPSKIVYENDILLAFEDIDPKAPHHVLLIPKKHIGSLNEADASDLALLGRMQLAVREVAECLGVDASGYRLVTNVGEDGGQTVGHLHYHLLGGRSLQWPPG